MNGQDLIELPETSGPERIRDFGRAATAYRDRLRDHDWETSIGAWVGIGRLTIAEHILLAVGKWPIHAWDHARAAEVIISRRTRKSSWPAYESCPGACREVSPGAAPCRWPGVSPLGRCVVDGRIRRGRAGPESGLPPGGTNNGDSHPLCRLFSRVTHGELRQPDSVVDVVGPPPGDLMADPRRCARCPAGCAYG